MERWAGFIAASLMWAMYYVLYRIMSYPVTPTRTSDIVKYKFYILGRQVLLGMQLKMTHLFALSYFKVFVFLLLCVRSIRRPNVWQ